MSSFPDILKHWRKFRRLSQLDLALEADVSARHISFLETGRANPSRDMISRLGEVLNIPLEARNGMFSALGFAPKFAKSDLSAETMAPIRKALNYMLESHAPYPGIALDRLWVVQDMNAPARIMFAPFGIKLGDSLLDLLKSNVLAQSVENWPEVAHHSALRLRAESAAAGGIEALDETANHLASIAEPTTDTSSPVIPTTYVFNGQRLSLIGTIAQFSTVNDQTVDDLKLELFYPADDASEAFLKGLSIIE